MPRREEKYLRYIELLNKMGYEDGLLEELIGMKDMTQKKTPFMFPTVFIIDYLKKHKLPDALKYDKPALVAAMFRGDGLLVKELLNLGYSPLKENKNKANVIMVAAGFKNPAYLKIILDHIKPEDLDKQDNLGMTAAHYVVVYDGHPDNLKALLEKRPELVKTLDLDGLSVGTWACKKTKWSVLEILDQYDGLFKAEPKNAVESEDSGADKG